MSDIPSFIDVRKAFVDSSDPLQTFDRLFGRTPSLHSILRNISFKLSQGQKVTLFGPSGSGKSTLLRLLTGIVLPSQGTVMVNSQTPQTLLNAADGYVSSELSVPRRVSADEVLRAFGSSHNIPNLPARIGELAQVLGIHHELHLRAEILSTTQRIRLHLARSILSDAPLILLDDVADFLDVNTIKNVLATFLDGRTVIIATRMTSIAETLDLPILLLHRGSVASFGTRDEIADTIACERLLDVWVEGLRYDLLRTLKRHAGVASVRLLPSSRFAGQRLRIVLQSSRYLPSLYDVLSQVPLLRVQEIPASLDKIIHRLEK